MPLRVMNHKLNMQGYSYELVHEPGVTMPSDYLSRHPTGRKLEEEEEKEIRKTEMFVNAVVDASLPEALTKREIEDEMAKDEEMIKLMEAVKQKTSKRNTRPELSQYKNVIEEMAIHRNVIRRRDQILVPPKLRKKAIALAHEGHQGIVKCKRFLRSSLWFPRMDKEMEKVVEECHTCQVVTDTKVKEPLKMVPIPDEPWKKTRADFYGPMGQEYVLVLQDEYSRYPEIEIVTSTDHRATIQAMDRMMSRFGIPEVVRSDNGPPFNGKEFSKFARYMGFEHKPVPPRAPWTNGLVERFMPNLKKVIQIAIQEGKNWKQEMQNFLRAYRATLHSTTDCAPAELMFNGRRYKTRLPCPQKKIVFIKQKEVKKKDEERKEEMKNAADSKRYVKPNDIIEGDRVLCRQENKNKLTTHYYPRPMVVVKRDGSRITA